MATLDFDREIETHRRALHVHCYRMLGSFTDAEDLVQETYLRAWRQPRGDYEAGFNLRAWLYRIATNVCIDAIRSRRRQVPLSGEPAEGPGSSLTRTLPTRRVARTGRRARCQRSPARRRSWPSLRAIQALPARQRAVLICTCLGRSPAEMAGALGHDASRRQQRPAASACATLRVGSPTIGVHGARPG